MAETNLKGALDTQLHGETSQHGVFRIGQTLYEVTLSQSSLSWTKMGAAADSAGKFSRFLSCIKGEFHSCTACKVSR